MSYEVYNGPSQLDGQPIFAVLTGVDTVSRNRKTGPMAQIWIMRSDISPLDAARTNSDASVCGDCKLRGDKGKGRSCYVTLFRAPTQIFRNKTTIKPAPANIFKNQVVRLGAYGDPAALPVELVKKICQASVLTTGYTHQWKTCDQELKQYLMASVDSEAEYHQAKLLGWSTFRVKTKDQSRLVNEMVCPASEEAGKKLSCFYCGKCKGGAKRDVVIDVHGIGKFSFSKLETTNE